MATITLPITMVDAEGYETTVNLPARFEICPQCRGAGTSSAPSARGGRDGRSQ